LASPATPTSPAKPRQRLPIRVLVSLLTEGLSPPWPLFVCASAVSRTGAVEAVARGADSVPHVRGQEDLPAVRLGHHSCGEPWQLPRHPIDHLRMGREV